MTFGRVISEARKKMSLSQKDLATMIKKEDGTPISSQYLNDIERDRRNASSDYLIKQFSHVLSIDSDILYFRAGELPADIRTMDADEDTIKSAYEAFRKELED